MLSDRTILITGASRGIGAATARLAARQGAAVCVNYLADAAAARRVVADIERDGGRALAVQADARQPRQVEAMVAAATRALGPIDGLVINANIAVPQRPIAGHAWDVFETKLVDEMRAAFHCVQAVLPGMLASRRGSIVAISSSVVQQPAIGISAHACAKAALEAFVHSLALELGPAGIRANLVAPGLTRTEATASLPTEVTEMVARATPLHRIALPEDVARAIVMLLDDESAFVTGNRLTVDGGMRVGLSDVDVSHAVGSAS